MNKIQVVGPPDGHPEGGIAVRATLHPDAPAALELLIARTRVLDYL